VAPHVYSFTPAGGKPGDSITLSGVGFGTATAVQFHSVAASFTVENNSTLTAVVPATATTGPIMVASPFGADTSDAEFFVGFPPTLTAVAPDSARLLDTVQILGSGLTGATRVSFSGSGTASFAVVSDTRIDAVVNSTAATGPITVVNPVGTTTSTFDFHLVDARTDVPVGSAGFGLETAGPNPLRSALRVAVTLPDATPARLELVDVSGRLLESREVGSLGPGRHTVQLAGGRDAPAGIRFVRLTQGARTATQRIAVLR
jgi:hypothetical protein